MNPQLLGTMKGDLDAVLRASNDLGLDGEHTSAIAAHGRDKLRRLVERTIEDHVDPERYLDPESEEKDLDQGGDGTAA